MRQRDAVTAFADWRNMVTRFDDPLRRHFATRYMNFARGSVA